LKNNAEEEALIGKHRAEERKKLLDIIAVKTGNKDLHIIGQEIVDAASEQAEKTVHQAVEEANQLSSRAAGAAYMLKSNPVIQQAITDPNVRVVIQSI